MDKTCLLVTGGTGSGKTVAACNVFTYMTLGGGISMTAPDGRKVSFELVADPHSRTGGKDIEDFHDTYFNMRHGKPLPIGSAESHTYELLFKCNGDNVCSLLYLDYRGGLTRIHNGTEQEQQENEDFDYMLEHAGILIYIIPGNILADYISLNGKMKTADMNMEEEEKFLGINREVSHIKMLMERADNLNAKAPILYYVTKSDFIPYENTIMTGLEGILRDWNLVRSNRKVLGCHSTLGRAVNIKKVLNDDGSTGFFIDGGFQPEGFEIPMMLTVGHRLSEAGKEWAALEMARINNEIEKASRNIYELEHGGMKGALIRFFQPGLHNERMEHAVKKRSKKNTEKSNIDENNVNRRYSMDILAYLEETFPNATLYLNENGQKRPLAEFIL